MALGRALPPPESRPFWSRESPEDGMVGFATFIYLGAAPPEGQMPMLTCVLCNRPSASWYLLPTGSAIAPAAEIMCRSCQELTLSDRKRLRDRAMVRLLASASPARAAAGRV